MPKTANFNQFLAFYYTKNLQKTADFYEQTLNLKLALDQGTCRIYEINPHAFIGFCENSQVKPSPETCIITLVTQDVDKVFQQLKNKNAHIIKPPEFNPKFNIYHCFIKDPNGYKIEIQKFLDPNWQ